MVQIIGKKDTSEERIARARKIIEDVLIKEKLTMIPTITIVDAQKKEDKTIKPYYGN